MRGRLAIVCGAMVKRTASFVSPVEEKKLRADQVVPVVFASSQGTKRPGPVVPAACVNGASFSSASSRGNGLEVWRKEEVPPELPGVEDDMAPDKVYGLMNAIGSEVIRSLPGFLKHHSSS